jgi:hypothetical protein
MTRVLRAGFAASVVTASLVSGALQAPAEAAPVVRFVKAYVNSPGSDNRSNSSLNAEWIRVKNFAASRRTLTGWTIRDASGKSYKFPSFSLAAGASVTLHTGRGANTRTDLYWGQDNYIWNNSGDAAALRNASATVTDRCSWRTVASYVAC